ncbi:hypothetical protein, partial [Pectobacterium brasiliense]|uniref:hypothetical protein n=1 Tax=Pectobacterium brasiliense TaxID=180957 RepID=UPI001969612E
ADNLFVTDITNNDNSRTGMTQKQKGRQSIDSFYKKEHIYPKLTGIGAYNPRDIKQMSTTKLQVKHSN